MLVDVKIQVNVEIICGVALSSGMYVFRQVASSSYGTKLTDVALTTSYILVTPTTQIELMVI